ncbi:4-hydroxybenzoate solanesyltransferase [Synechococcus sp. PCC 7336]|uniref:4-hydroxybenzoate solanesyltransferase n=1 Tax=Synechococcus sp. PCC 7336 TaxID=195250 RepID=UPI0003742D1F|nr:4-hydroxybenzoate solanesyltransferase [Synechococcus sp. PCC 7336]
MNSLLAIVQLLRWDKPAGRLILMVPALWGAFLAGRGTPPPLLIAVVVVGTLATSAAGCVINDIWDRNLDPLVDRTKDRPLASQKLSLGVAAVVGTISLICAFVLATFLNPVTFALCVAAVPAIALYPGAKRIFPVPQLVLAIAWGFAVLISWTAVAGQLPDCPIWEPATLFLWGATVLWTLGFDTVYAMSDRSDDERVGILSSARFFGPLTPTAVGFFFLGTAIFLVCVGLTMQLHASFYAALGLCVAAWGWQTKRLHQRQPPKSLFPQVFRQNVAIGFVLLAGMIAGTLL